MTDCIFCKIVAGELPCHEIAQSDNFLAFLSIAQIMKGHTLVIPKKHYTDFSEFPSELGTEWTTFTKQVMGIVHKGMSAQGTNVGMNNGSAAGQEIFHQHTHIIPRVKDDGLGGWPHNDFEHAELVQIRKQILDKNI